MSKARKKHANWKTVISLLLCFPYGLYRMWRFTRWNLALKGLITVCILAAVTFILLPITSPPTVSGGVKMVGAEKDVRIFGPELPEAMDENFVGYGSVTSSQGPLFAEDDAGSSVVYVYANENGEYYHKLNCKYVAWYSKKMELPVAYYSGYSPCEECGAPTFSPGGEE